MAGSPSKKLDAKDWKSTLWFTIVYAAIVGLLGAINSFSQLFPDWLNDHFPDFAFLGGVVVSGLKLVQRYLTDYQKRVGLWLFVGLGSSLLFTGCLAATPHACHAHRGPGLRSFHNSDGSTHVYEVLPGELNIERQPHPVPAPAPS